LNKYFDDIKSQLRDQKGIGAGDGTSWFYPHPINKKTLELGFGAGELIRKLITLKNEVHGIDIGLLRITDAERDGTDKKAKLNYLDVSNDKFPYPDNYFDCVYALEMLEHTENPSHIFHEVKRVLKPDGDFIIAYPRPEDNLQYRSGGHAHVYPGFLMKHSFRMFCDQNYFKLIKYAENGSTAWNWLSNVKTGDEIGIHELIQGNYDKETLYGHLHGKDTWDEKNDPEYILKSFQAIDLTKGIKVI
jgi:ubiquinone/menaquinone biosynthesis C-methylase UbiE